MKKKMKTVTIPKDEYEQLLDCRRIVEKRYPEELSEAMKRDIEKSQDDIRKGKYVKFKNWREAKKHLDAL